MPLKLDRPSQAGLRAPARFQSWSMPAVPTSLVKFVWTCFCCGALRVTSLVPWAGHRSQYCARRCTDLPHGSYTCVASGRALARAVLAVWPPPAPRGRRFGRVASLLPTPPAARHQSAAFALAVPLYEF